MQVPALVVLNKIDKAKPDALLKTATYFKGQSYCKELVEISALKGLGINALKTKIVDFLPVGEAFYGEEELSDLPLKFFIAEMIREKIFDFFEDEIPYHTTVLVSEYKQKSTLVKIRAEIIVQRESQKAIILGEGGKMIKKIGTEARKEIENFIEQKSFLELFVKVRPKWRENELFLKEYGY